MIFIGYDSHDDKREEHIRLVHLFLEWCVYNNKKEGPETGRGLFEAKGNKTNTVLSG